MGELPAAANVADLAVLDVHTHAMPMPLLRSLAGAGYADLSAADKNIVRISPELSGLAAGAPIPFSRDQYDLGSRLRSMDALGVAQQAVSAPPFVFGSESLDEDLVMDVTRRTNDAIAEFVHASGGRLLGLASLPVGLPGAPEELRRCSADLGLAGATIGTFGGGRELDDPINEPLWAALADSRCFVLLHPSKASSPERLTEYHLVQLLGYPAETALAAARLVFGGVLDRHDLVICLAHGGGCLRGISGRLDLGWDRKLAARTIDSAPGSYLDRFYYDTAVFDTVTLRRMVDDLGVDRVLLGTDTPFDLADLSPIRTIRDLGLNRHDTQAVLGSNARRLLGGMVGPTRDSRAAVG